MLQRPIDVIYAGSDEISGLLIDILEEEGAIVNFIDCSLPLNVRKSLSGLVTVVDLDCVAYNFGERYPLSPEGILKVLLGLRLDERAGIITKAPIIGITTGEIINSTQLARDLNSELIQKPFNIGDLIHAVNSALVTVYK